MEQNSSSTGDARRTKFLIFVLLMTWWFLATGM
jgi:hypothetical protein